MKIETQVHGKKKYIEVPRIGSVLTVKKKVESPHNEPIPKGQSTLITGYEHNGMELVIRVRYLNYNYYIPVRELHDHT